MKTKPGDKSVNALPRLADKRGRPLCLLYQTDLFRGVEPKELALFFDEVEQREYPAGSMVFMPGDSASERLFILKEGKVTLYRLTASGKRLVTGQVLPGSTFGVMGLLGRSMQGDFAEATEASTVCMVTRENVLAILKRQPDLALRVLEFVGNRLRLIEERLVETVYSPASVRLAHYLLANADPASGVLANVTHEEIGDTIGAVRQTVTETLSLMRKQGLLATGVKRIRITDRRGLEKIAGGHEPGSGQARAGERRQGLSSLGVSVTPNGWTD